MRPWVLIALDNGPVPDVDPDVRAYYDRGQEAGRLRDLRHPSGPLELVRTQELLLRHLNPAPLDILDVGGGPGAHALWLAEHGHRVHVVDLIPLHVQEARAAGAGITAELGDARQLAQADASADVVLLLGPLYHLVARDDRLCALREARRVLRPNGLLFAAAISRFAALLDLLVRLDRLQDPEVFSLVEASVHSGVFRGHESGLFTTAYFHLPKELEAEVAEAGFVDGQLFNIEGPGFLISDFEQRWKDEQRREAILRAARLVEMKTEMLGVSSHLLVAARAPGSIVPE
jgi:SAM-dependent methyltransferase